MEKVIAVIGPTGVGKTAVGVELAKWLQSEIISGDSIQVYRGLDIGSAKVTEEEMQGIPHHLIDILPIDAKYSVYDFQQQGRKAMKSISEQGKIPLVVGGTGLYIKSLLYDYEFESEEGPDTSKYANYTNEELYAMLAKVDPASLEKIHMNNRKRVIRALVIHDTHGVSKSEWEAKQEHEMLYDAYIIGLTCERERVYDRINRRVDKMMEAGLVEEVTNLQQYPDIFSYQGMQGIGYREFQAYFHGTSTLEEVSEEIKKHSRQFAKRQYTWFHNQMPVHWYDVTKENFLEDIKKDIQKWKESEGE
ncbi:MAG: tRNA (adenosine(37)-N6)-dimethylallyltransferase MiaA [Erysipelotrichaceae bacterium]|nr:tRNA (adenosine(37)-N6)-dimethylallyltransferase MiaA [Erysipelotrichaceae bacterium]MBQ9986905.1 tRNA (adenosine(37)-N6)-dimethylallyltransferase MiaA [Erysipelotrichales bacterium]MBR3692921.1 tRNA (adenosine(37)-N6)-dimethylallyltransferase MiaA [Erysipelotrichales bacterium]